MNHFVYHRFAYFFVLAAVLFAKSYKGRASDTSAPIQRFYEGEYLPLFSQKPYAMVSEGAPLEWGVGAVQAERYGAVFLVSQAVDASKLSPSLSAWVGASVNLYQRNQRLCQAQIRGFRLVEYTFEEGLLKDSEEKRFITDAEKEKVWPSPLPSLEKSYQEQTMTLVADLDSLEACAGAEWAQLAELPAAEFAKLQKTDAQLKTFIVRSLAKTQSYQKKQAEYVAFLKERTASKRTKSRASLRWDSSKASHNVYSYRFLSDSSLYILGVVREGSICSDQFAGEAWALWKVYGEGKKRTFQLIMEGTSVPGGFFDGLALFLMRSGTKGNLFFGTSHGAVSTSKSSDAKQAETYQVPIVPMCSC